jgi:hypothetical protein
MSVQQQINDFIKSKHPTAVCNSCIASALGMANKGAHPAQITGALATTSDFTQRDGECAICGETKKVIRSNRR